MWNIIFGAALVIFIACLFYISKCFSHIFSEYGICSKKAILYGIGITLALFLVLTLIFRYINAAVILIHLTLILLAVNFVCFVFRKVSKKKIRKAVSVGISVILTVLCLVYAYYCAVNVIRTEYKLETNKNIPEDGFRIVGFSDAHLGATFGWEEFGEYIERINAESPDIVVIAGDFADDSTSLEIMQRSCDMLSLLTPKYGTYFVMGNHDSGMGISSRGYGEKELIESLEKNGVTVLRDEIIRIPGTGINIVGRLDKSYHARADISDLISKTDGYTVVLDHQPGDYESEANSGADLVISGHTHGGQFFPITYLGKWLGINDRTYGYEHRENTDFIVSSGISCWELKFKTGCRSEYFIIDIKSL